MNERIVALAVKAGVTFDWDPGTDGPEVYFDRQEDFEKFAEMIVLECAFYMYENYPHSRYEVNYMRRHMGDADWNKPIKDQLELNDERTD